MIAHTQLPLPLAASADPVADGLIVAGACNEAALKAVLADPAEWPQPALALIGAPASGKTMLAQAWVERHIGALWRAEELSFEAVQAAEGDARAVAVDGLDGLADEEALFHLCNAVIQQGGRLLLTARAALPALDIRLPDLRTRLRAIPQVDILPPDDIFLSALFRRLAERRQLPLSGKVADFCLLRMERSCRAALSLIEALDRLSLAAGGPVSLELAALALAELEAAEGP